MGQKISSVAGNFGSAKQVATAAYLFFNSSWFKQTRQFSCFQPTESWFTPRRLYGCSCLTTYDEQENAPSLNIGPGKPRMVFNCISRCYFSTWKDVYQISVTWPILVQFWIMLLSISLWKNWNYSFHPSSLLWWSRAVMFWRLNEIIILGILTGIVFGVTASSFYSSS